jgi:ABC-type bacteriocin/lantibiotic exporter with double-glycine peptidase domain
MDNIMAMGNKPTLIMVAHRLSTLEICNRILLLDKGKIIQQGRLDEVQKTLKLTNEREEKE